MRLAQYQTIFTPFEMLNVLPVGLGLKDDPPEQLIAAGSEALVLSHESWYYHWATRTRTPLTFHTFTPVETAFT